MISVEKDEARMVRWICRVRPEEKISAKELKLNSMMECFQDIRLQCISHLERVKKNAWRISDSFPRWSERRVCYFRYKPWYFRNMEQSLLEQSYFPKDCKIKDALFYHDELLSQKILECWIVSWWYPTAYNVSFLHLWKVYLYGFI